MLQAIREKSQGWISWTIVSIICVVFSLWGIHSYLYNNRADETVAKVNGTKIPTRQLMMTYDRLKRRTQMQTGNYVVDPKTSRVLKKAALQGLISELVLQKAARKAGFYVAPELVEVALLKMPIFQIDGEFSKERFDRVLNDMLFSPEQFLSQLEAQILMNEIRSGIVDTEFMLPNEVKKNIALVNQERRFHYVMIPASQFVSKVKLSNGAVKQYYKAHQQEFALPEKVSVEYLKISLSDLMRTIHPTEAQLKQFYQDNILSYTRPKQWRFANILIKLPVHAMPKQVASAKHKVDDVAELIKSGTAFADLVKKYSEDKNTVGREGKLPYLTEAQLRSLGLAQVAKTLKTPGDVSAPIKTERGYEIIQLVAIQPKKVHAYGTLKDKLVVAYKQQHAQKQFSDMSDQLANITYESPNSLNKASEQLHLLVQATALFTREGGAAPIIKDEKIIKAAFDDSVLQGNNSDLINLNEDSVVVLRVKQHISGSIKPFDQVKGKIIEQLKQMASATQAENLGQRLIQTIKTKQQPLQAVIRPYHFVMRVTPDVKRYDKQVPEAILQAGFQLPPKVAANNVTGVALSNGDYAVVLLNAVKDGSLKDLAKPEQGVFHQTIEKSFGVLGYQLYIDGLMKKAKIVRYELEEE